jgi:organic radical activating enzyme
MNKIELPESYSYIGVFLTLSCNLSCSYCINHLVGLKKGRKLLRANEWTQGLARISSKKNIPLSLQGGEPTIHPDFFDIVKQMPNDIEMDLLTNIQFDPDEFARQIPLNKFNRPAPYAAIRVSYHPETMDFEETKLKVKKLIAHGFKVGLYGVLHPSQGEEVLRAKAICEKEGIDFRTKEFLGMHDGKLHGTYAYPGAVFAEKVQSCLCKTTELLIDPFGDIFRCHHDLYNRINPIGNLLDRAFRIQDEYRPCAYYGKCNPCDVKVKTNYLQQHGHTSVDILLDA